MSHTPALSDAPKPLLAVLRWLPALLLLAISGSMMLSMLAQTPALFQTRNRITESRKLVDEADREVQRLKAAREYARGDGFTERWARTQARWARRGENVVGIPAPGVRDRSWLDDFALD